MATGYRRNTLFFVIFAAVLLAGHQAAAEPPSYVWIQGITPTVLDPRGQVVTITGGFQPPVSVFFDLGPGRGLYQAWVVSASRTSITAIALAIDVEPLGWRSANLVVVAPAGSVVEQRATLTNAVRFERPDLPPSINVVSPRGVPRTGGTLLTFLGQGFHAPLQAFTIHADGSESEMQVSGVRFDQVTVLTPPAERSESVGVRVVNVLTGRSFVLQDAFRYVTPMSITSVTPSAGPFSGGTRVTIAGSGFPDRVAVLVGGIPAQAVEIAEHQIVAVTGTLTDPQCSNATGIVDVMSVDDGTNTGGAPFTFITPRSEFRFVPSQTTAGSVLSVIVKDDLDQTQFQLSGPPFDGYPSFANIDIVSRDSNVDGSATYRLRIPAEVAFSDSGCLPGPRAMTLRLANPRTGCHDTRPLFVVPGQNVGRCRPGHGAP